MSHINDKEKQVGQDDVNQTDGFLNAENFKVIVQTAMDGFILVDIQGRVLEVNEAYCRMSGYSREELHAMSISDLEVEENAEDIETHLQKVMSQGDDRFDSKHRHKDGHIFHVEVSVKYQSTNGGLFVVFIRDITETIRMRQNLQESEERMNLFFSQSLDGFFFMMIDQPVSWDDSTDKEKVLDYVFEHQRTTRVNQAMLDQYRATEEQFIGLTPNDFFAHDIQHGRVTWTDFFDNGHLHVDTHEKKFDGTDMIIEGDYICLYDSQRRITGHFGIQRDVTSARMAEEELQKSKSEFEEYFENDISADYLASTEGEIFSCNKTFLALFDFEKRSQARKFNITRLYKDPNDRKELLRRVKEAGQVENYEVEFISRLERPIYAVINAIGVFDEAGRLKKVRGYVVDITDRKEIEKRLSESEKSLVEKVSDLNLLAGSSSTLMNFKTRDDIYNFLHDSLYSLSGADYMLVTEYRERDNSIIIRQLVGLKSYQETIVKATGIDLNEIKIPVYDLAHQKELSERKKIYHVDGGLYELSTRKVPKAICKTIEKILGQ